MQYDLSKISTQQLLALARGLEVFDALAALSSDPLSDGYERVDPPFEERCDSLYREVMFELVRGALEKGIGSLYLTDECGEHPRAIRSAEEFAEEFVGPTVFHTLRTTHSSGCGADAIADALAWRERIDRRIGDEVAAMADTLARTERQARAALAPIQAAA